LIAVSIVLGLCVAWRPALAQERPRTDFGLTPYFQTTDDGASTPLPVPPSAPASQKSEWQFEITPYTWLASLRGEASKGPLDGSADVCVSESIKELELGGLVRLEARNHPWGFYLEGLYLSVGDDSRVRLGRFRLRGVDVNFDAVLSFVDFGGMYRIGDAENSLDLMGGGRFTYLSNDVSVGPIDPHDTKRLVDPIIGARYQRALSERWSMSLQGDIGGFGVDTDLVWSLAGLLGYRLSERTTLAFGYRYYDFEQSEYDIQLHGPMIGLAFSF